MIADLSFLLDVAVNATTAWRSGEDQVRRLRASRDGAIRAALAAGHTPAQVADAAGLSRERVYQIRDRRR